ncbi:PREDICTED: uncharacterized protein LOC105564976 [Vollenhovia emeryi]|uniref:uncharacterized protein LOC105564976 n=1 Tax=Vollenhovia emeryi TaxID=411798 RepID=UPI0005F3D3A7|nr:PREDICTED: uncharacterized protein LOC105564976 [Vollenhovia emeryi]
MKLFARPKCFSEIIAPVTTVNCIVGLRAFEYPRGNPRPILSLIYLAFIYITFCCGIFIHQKNYPDFRLMKLEYVVYKLTTYIVLVSVIVKMLLGWWHTKKFKVCLKKIFEIDETLQQLGLTVNYDRLYFVMIGIITVLITFVLVIWIWTMFIHLHTSTDVFTSIYLLLIKTYSFIVNSINIFEFFIFAKCSQIKFKLVNQLLRESLTDLSKEDKKLGIFDMKDYERIIDVEQQKQVFSTKMIFRRRQRVQTGINFSISKKRDPVVFQTESHFPSHVTNHFQSVLQNPPRRHNTTITKCEKPKHLLQVIRQVHLKVCKVTKIVSTILGVQVAWDIGVIMMALIVSFYHLYIRYIMSKHDIKYLTEQTFVTLSLCSFHVMKIFTLNRVCKNAADEGNRTAEIIHSIYGCNTDIDIKEEIQQFGLQVLQSPVTFSAFSLTLDNRVLSMILMILTTYMVFVIQMGNELESNNAIPHAQV